MKNNLVIMKGDSCMLKKKSLILRMAPMLTAFAMVVVFNNCWFVIGEPKLPKKILKTGPMD